MPRQLGKRWSGNRDVDGIPQPFLPWLPSALGRRSKSKSNTSCGGFVIVGSVLIVHCAQMRVPVVSRLSCQLSEGLRDKPSSSLISSFEISS